MGPAAVAVGMGVRVGVDVLLTRADVGTGVDVLPCSLVTETISPQIMLATRIKLSTQSMMLRFDWDERRIFCLQQARTAGYS